MKLKKGYIIAGSILGAVLFVYIGISIYFMNSFNWGTKVNGVDCSNLSIREAEEKVSNEANTYALKLAQRQGKTETVTGSDIDLVSHMDGKLVDVMDKQSAFMWPIDLIFGDKIEVPSSLEYDEKKLDTVIAKLTCFDKKNIQKPQSAKLAGYVNESDGFKVIPEVLGTQVDKKKLKDTIKSCIAELNRDADMDKEGCYVAPKLKADTDEMKKLKETADKYGATKITYKFGSDTEVVDGKMIEEWISINSKNQVVLSETKIRKYLDSLASKYNTFGVKRPFVTSYGDAITIGGGDYGWWMNAGKETKELIKDIKKGQEKEKEPAYYQKAVNYSEKDYGNTYVEVNITKQHMFLYVDGKKITESDIVTGCVAKKHDTPTGIFPILYRERNKTLKGQGYSSPVSYWMPFVGGVGLHDANWRHGKFGGKIYLNHGSHGCVNLPVPTAKIIFEHVRKGTPVIVYK